MRGVNPTILDLKRKNHSFNKVWALESQNVRLFARVIRADMWCPLFGKVFGLMTTKFSWLLQASKGCLALRAEFAMRAQCVRNARADAVRLIPCAKGRPKPPFQGVSCSVRIGLFVLRTP